MAWPRRRCGATAKHTSVEQRQSTAIRGDGKAWRSLRRQSRAEPGDAAALLSDVAQQSNGPNRHMDERNGGTK